MPSKQQIALAFGLVYLLWGSTFLGIRYAIETLPPFLMAGCRFIIAGAVLYGFSLTRTSARPWAAGSIASRRLQLPVSSLMAAGMEMLAGGMLLTLVGLLAGEGARLDLASASGSSAVAFFYLIVFGSLVGFSAYNWLLGATTAARVSTYAYVKPVVAVFLGWLIADETLTLRTVLAAAVIVTAVALIITHRARVAVGKGPLPQVEQP